MIVMLETGDRDGFSRVKLVDLASAGDPGAASDSGRSAWVSEDPRLRTYRGVGL